MGSQIFNVRLSPEDAKRVAELKKQGVQLTSLVRSAIRAEHARLHPKPKWRSAKELLDQIFAEFPEPAGSARAPKRSDRRSLQNAFREHVQRKHRRIQQQFLGNGRRGTKRKAT